MAEFRKKRKKICHMCAGKDLNYKDILQVDGAFSACHINYGKSLKFNGADSKNMAQNSRKNSFPYLYIAL